LASGVHPLFRVTSAQARTRGFTLIEVVIALAIVGVLASAF
jgi:prepilin-type N-terminal cleavage/methylation domain-containing protein